MFHLLPHFFAYFSKVHVSHIFSAQIGIFDGNFDIVSVSITYLYQVSLPQPSACQQNDTIHVSGPMWNEMG